MKDAVLRILYFYTNLNRPLTLLEIWRLLPTDQRSGQLNELVAVLDDSKITSDGGFYSLNPKSSALSRRKQDLLLDKKWRRFLKLNKLFNWIPFIDFVLGSGSLALGNVHKDSDFDVIIGCRQDRVFTVRLFCIIIFGLRGVRRKKIDHKEAANNKVCLNHFVTPAGYQLQPPHNFYWQQLYQNLVFVFGDQNKVQKFFKANNWLKGENFRHTEGHFQNKAFNFWRFFWEIVLRGYIGNLIEKWSKKIQLQRIEKNINLGKMGFEPRLHYSDQELEFHPDTLKIQ